MARSGGATKDLDALKLALRGRGLRATPSRLAVLGLLRRHPGPLSHAEAADKLQDQGWDRATIYRNLTDLAEANLARRADVGDHVWRFEAIDVAHVNDHNAHFVCTECGIVECLPGVDISVTRTAPRAIKQKQVEIQVRGRCDGCET